MYSNQTNLPTAIAVWLAHDTYDRAEAMSLIKEELIKCNEKQHSEY